MKLSEYRAFTERLRQNLAQDERVIGLVAVGSMAEQDVLPDQWSDHDFFVVTRPGEQESLRAAADWLPDKDRIAIWFRDTAHGLKVIYDSGHLLEYAVFDTDEYEQIRVNRFRVLLDRGGIEEQSLRLVQKTADEALADPAADRVQFGQFISNLMVGAGRTWRGERLSGHEFIKGHALRQLVALLVKYLPAEKHSLLDNLSPVRRFELAYPEIGAELDAIFCLPPLGAAIRLLDVAERALASAMPDYPAGYTALARRYLAAAGPGALTSYSFEPHPVEESSHD